MTEDERRETLERLMDEYGTALQRMCCLELRDRTLAQDAVQDTFLKAYLKNQEAASPYIMAAGFDAKPRQTPAPLRPGERHWRDEIVRYATPGEQDLTMAQALDIAKAALIEEFGFAKEDFEEGRFSYMDDPDFYQRADGSRIWLFSLNAVRQGVECGCGVAVDAATGEIVFSQIITGGNG